MLCHRITDIQLVSIVCASACQKKKVKKKTTETEKYAQNKQHTAKLYGLLIICAKRAKINNNKNRSPH